MKAWVNGIGWWTAAGSGQGREASGSPLVPGELEIPTRKQVFAKADLRFGRLDRFSRIGLAALACCLRDAGQEQWSEKRPLGIIAASRYGCLQTDLDYLASMLPERGQFASPNLFAYTLPNCFLGEAALRFGLTGTTLVLSGADRDRLAALRYGLEELCWGDAPALLAGICDLPAPAELAAADDCPGSLFLLLSREAAATSYGELRLEDENILFAGQQCPDLATLVSACLQAIKE